jgi:DNA-binding MarR family transcriptional regulator
MKHPEDDWGGHPPMEPLPPFAEEEARLREDPPELAAIRRIELLGRLHHMAFGSQIRQNGLPPAQAGAMRDIIQYPGLSQRELADKLHIQRATATVMLQKMEKSGYIQRLPDQDDQRISRIYPTDLARSVDAEQQKTVNAYFARCFAGISQEEFAAMETALEKLGDNLREILRETPETHE